MSLYDILACPNCHLHVDFQQDHLNCSQCGTDFPVINGVPIMFPDGSQPEIVHQSELAIRKTYDPWVHRLILQSLLDDQIVVEVGSGNMILDDPSIIRMDVQLSPYVDLVADAHFMPFLPGSIDFVFSLAVFEHLQNPFQTAQSIFEVLKDGGYIYHECNFVFAYHGYPHHYFNMSMQGLEQVFAKFFPLQKGVAPYQMPSFAVDMILRSYLGNFQFNETDHGYRLLELLHHLIDFPLMDYDIYFSEQGAMNIAAGTFFAGMKKLSAESSLIPDVIRSIWKQDLELQEHFPDINLLNSADNILLWAKSEGRDRFPEIASYLAKIIPFNKRGAEFTWDRSAFQALPIESASFGAVGYPPEMPMPDKVQQAEYHYRQWINSLRNQRPTLIHRIRALYRTRGWRAALRTILYELLKRI